MNEAIDKHSHTAKAVGAAHSQARSLSTVRPLTDTPNLSDPLRPQIKSIPFTGLLTNKLLAQLPGEEFARLLPYLEPVSLTAHDYVYGLGNKVDFIYFPETAVISHIHLLEDGNTTEVALVGNEGVVGLSALLGAPATNYWSQVIVAGSALRVRAEFFREEFSRGQAVQRLLLFYTGERIAQISQRAVCNGRHPLSGRLACWLLMLHDRTRDNQLKLTHEEIARHLGARRASISVAATALKDNGIISYNRGHIRVLNRQALMGHACECYRTLNRTASWPGNDTR